MEQEPKGALQMFLQRKCGRSIGKEDVKYTVDQYDEGYQATLHLPCLQDGMEFVGELGSSAKEAEKLAAKQALQQYATEVKAGNATFVSTSKWKQAAPAQGKPLQRQALQQQSAPQPEVGNVKSSLTTFLQKTLRRPLIKEDMSFDVAKYDEGFQCTLRLPGLNESAEFVGEVASNSKDAQTSAAQIALNSFGHDALPQGTKGATKGAGKPVQRHAVGSPTFTGAKGAKAPFTPPSFKGAPPSFKGAKAPVTPPSFTGSKGGTKAAAIFAKGNGTSSFGAAAAFGKGKGQAAQGKGQIIQGPMRVPSTPVALRAAPQTPAAALRGRAAPMTPPGVGGFKSMLGATALGGKGMPGKAPSYVGGKPSLVRSTGTAQARLSPMASKLKAAPKVAAKKELVRKLPVEESRPKSKMNTFLQRLLRRPVGKTDQEITVETLDEDNFQATLILHCLNDEVYVGEIAPTEKEAVDMACAMALTEHAAEFEAVSQEFAARPKKRKREEGEPSAPPDLADKVELNSVVGKCLRGPLMKGTIVFETSRQDDGLYQSVVSVDGIADDEGSSVWSGEECNTKQLAEHSAARAALNALLASPEVQELLAVEPARKKGKGKGKFNTT
jgi:dsRNA-specific ribonuclease